MLWSGKTRMPLLAMTGASLAAIRTVRNKVRRAAKLAMRKVSTAEARPMVVKFGKTRNPNVLVVDGVPIVEAGWTIAIFLCKLRRNSSGAVKN